LGKGVLKNWTTKNLAEREGYSCDSLPYSKSAQARHLTSATMRYAATLADPTLDLSIAHPIVQPTYEAGMVAMKRYRANTVMTCHSTSGPALSWIVVCPGASGPYGDRNVATVTDGTYTGTVIGAAAGAGPVNWIETPYVAGLTDQDALNWRLTACVVRIRNVTPSMYRGGVIALAESPGHSYGAWLGFDFDTVAGLKGTTLHDLDMNDGEYLEILWHPQDTGGFDEGASETDALNVGCSGLKGFTHYETAMSAITDKQCSELVAVCKNPKVAGTTSPQELQISINAIYEMRGYQVAGKSLYRREAAGTAVMDAAITDLSATSGSLDSSKTWHDQGAGPLSAQVGRYVKTAVDLAAKAAPIATDVLALLGVAP
jgi:hypothetical protein